MTCVRIRNTSQSGRQQNLEEIIMLSSPLVVQIPPSMQMTDEQFFDFCQVNRELRIERNQFGEISIMSPTGSETGNRNFNVAGQVFVLTPAQDLSYQQVQSDV